MGSWSEQQEANKERKEKDKTRRDKLAGYFFNLSQLTFVALVLGGVTPLYTNIEVGINWYILVAVCMDVGTDSERNMVSG